MARCPNRTSSMLRTGRCWTRSRPGSRRWASCPTPASSAPLLRFTQDMPGRGHRPGPRGQQLHIRYAQCMPGPQGALVPDQGRQGCGRDERVRDPARRGQPEDAPVPTRSVPHTAQRLASGVSTWAGTGSCGAPAPGTQHVVEYQEETRSHLLALCASTRGADVRPQRGDGHLEQEHAAGPKGGLRLGGRRCGSRRRSSRSWTRA
jgi:hypothetical protein